MNMMTTEVRGILPPAGVLRSLPPRNLARAIEKVMIAHGSSISRFGRTVAGDPNLVLQLHAGREMRPAMRDRVLAHLETLRAGSAVRA